MSTLNANIYTTPATLDYELGSFRFLNDYSQEEIRIFRERTPIAFFIIESMVEEALQNSYNFKTRGDKEVKIPVSKEKKKKHLDRANVKMNQNYRSYGYSVAARVNINAFETIRWFTDSAVKDGADVIFEMQTKENEFVKITKARYMLTTPNGIFRFEYEGEKLETHVFIMINEGARIMSAQSILAPIWDNIFIIFVIDQQSGLYAQRVGAGIHRLLVDQSFFNDEPEMEALRTQIFDMWDNMGDKSKFMMAGNIGGYETKHDLYTGSGTINFEEIHDIQLLKITAVIGAPKERMEGKNIAKAASEVNQKNYITQLEKIQNNSNDFLLWGAANYLEIKAQSVDHNQFKELEETQVAELNKQRIDTFKAFEPFLIKYKIDVNEFLKFLSVKDLSATQPTEEEIKAKEDQAAMIAGEDPEQLPEGKKKEDPETKEETVTQEE